MQTRARPAGVRGGAAALGVAIGALACSPVFDWRQTNPEGLGVALMFPCRPHPQERTVHVGATAAAMQLFSCQAGGSTFALATLQVADPAAVTPLLVALREQAVANLSGTAREQNGFTPPGATPNIASGRWTVAGARPDGTRVVAHAAFFVKGLRLYQASVLGADETAGREAVDTFFDAIRLP